MVRLISSSLRTRTALAIGLGWTAGLFAGFIGAFWVFLEYPVPRWTSGRPNVYAKDSPKDWIPQAGTGPVGRSPVPRREDQWKTYHPHAASSAHGGKPTPPSPSSSQL